MASAVEWISRTGEARLDFCVTQQKGGLQVYAELFQKNVQQQFQTTNIIISERDMVVETENLHALMRGIPQKAFYVSQLSSDQKNNLIKSLSDRNITIERGHQSASITIHALP